MGSMLMRLTATVAGVLLLAVGAAPTAAAAATGGGSSVAVPLPPGAVGPFQIRNLYNGRCLDAPWGAGNGTQVHLWDCFGRANVNQHWYLASDRRGRYLLINGDTGRCLDAVWNGPNGLPVVVWDCYFDMRNANQLWYVRPADQAGPGPIIDLNGRVVDARWQSIAWNGTPIQLWDNYGSGQRNQQWSLVYNF